MVYSPFHRLSIVIPVGSDDQSWTELLIELSVFGKETEIIIAACQSQPDDLELPENVLWTQSMAGRAIQLNSGAQHTTRDVVWFLHADTRITTTVMPAVKDFINSEEYRCAYFQLKFANDGPRQTSLNAWAANIRSRFFGLPFGDQGFILNKSLFDHLKGFDERITLGEDLDFVVRVQAENISLQELPAQLMTSARRYQQHGWLLTTLRHVWLTWQLTRQAKQRLAFES